MSFLERCPKCHDILTHFQRGSEDVFGCIQCRVEVARADAVCTCPRCAGAMRVPDPENEQGGMMPCPHCEGDGYVRLLDELEAN